MIPEKILKAMKELGRSSLLPVQEAVFPLLTSHHSIAVQSATGTGKTYAYLIPAASMKEKTLIIAPTRELAVQIRDELQALTVYEGIRCALLIGGTDPSVQLNQLRQDPLFIIATPGRLCDCLEKNEISLKDISIFVMDEADMILTTGQYEQLRIIMEKLPETVTYVCVSATWNEKLSSLFSREMKMIRMDDPEKINKNITSFCFIAENKKEALLQILNDAGVYQALVFVNHKSDADKLAEYLVLKGFPAAPFSSFYTEKQRLQTIRQFKEGTVRILTATDAAARGLDLPVSHIIHYDLPVEQETLIHRSGRTAHQGNTGISVTILTPQEASSEAGRFYSGLPAFVPDASGNASLSLPSDYHTAETGTQKYLLRAGKKDKLRKGDIIGALCTAVPYDEIGTVDLQDRYAVITILRQDDTITEKLRNLTVKGKKRRIEILKDENSLSFRKGRR